MTTFDEQFPSISIIMDRNIWGDKYINDPDKINDRISCVSCLEIQRTCLDRQRVREAINKHLNCENHNICDIHTANIPCNMVIFRELGL